MDEKREQQKIKETTEKKKSRCNNVVIVQTAVCAFLIFLIVLTGKLSPQTFELIKTEYEKIMAVDRSASELITSAADKAKNVMSIKAAAADYDDSGPQIQTQTDEQEDSVAVMSTLGKNKEITVPVHGRITSDYGYRTNPISGAYALHTGVDIAADEGTDIVAAYNGVVKDTGVGEKRGKYVLMQHSDGSETLYCHCSKILVDEGDVVMAGEVLALVGSTGWSTGPHLHFEIRRDGNAVDPLDILSVKNGKV